MTGRLSRLRNAVNGIVRRAAPAAPDPAHTWFVQFAAATPGATPGAPWGASTAYAARAAVGTDPWDAGCDVTTFAGGYAAMSAIRQALEECLTAAKNATGDDKGLVYIAGWRLNPLRDLSVDNAWEAAPWMDPVTKMPYPEAQRRDQTVLGLLLKLIAARVQVRVLLWMPTSVQSIPLRGHAEDHLYLASAIREANKGAQAPAAGRAATPDRDYGVVCLDSRVAESGRQSIAAAHHQKMCVIRLAGDSDAYAFVGGVDLAYTRRDTPAAPATQPPEAAQTGYFAGDWQSGEGVAAGQNATPQGMPALTDGWPLGDPSTPGNWSQISPLKRPRVRFHTDLNVPAYGASNQRWHDQHLQVKGPAVATVQQQFCERWIDPGILTVLGDDQARSGLTGICGQAILSSKNAVTKTNPDDIDANAVASLPPVGPIDAGSAGSLIQMWRTIPARPRTGIKTSTPLFAHGEFTVLAGYANAIKKSSKLIFICDQYFWSIPAARSLNRQLKAQADLAIVIVLPPHADSTNGEVRQASGIHLARKYAIDALIAGLDAEQRGRVGVFNAWNGSPEIGVYVHAKTHVYDATLLVCGSANINRRSLTGDSELALAVLDPFVAATHLRKLWDLFTAGADWPTLHGHGYDASTDPGATFLLGFQDAQNLIIDPQFEDPSETVFTLRNNAQRDIDMYWTPFAPLYRDLMENCSMLPELIEGNAASDDLPAMSSRVENPANFAKIGRSPIFYPTPLISGDFSLDTG